MADRRRFGELRERLDSKGMLDLVKAFPSHMLDAWELGARFAGSIERRRVSRVVVCGVGGSAIGGDLVRSYLGDRLSCALHVNRAYRVPAALRGDAFFVFSSYSGDTAETLSAYEALRGDGVPAAAITSGGELEKRCREDGVPVCVLPSGIPPRAAVAYSFFPLLLALEALGSAKVDKREFEEAVAALERRCGEYSNYDSANEATELAGGLAGKLPFVYSCGGLFGGVARRWSSQLNENAKSLCHFAAFTELNHNEIVGWSGLETLRGRIAVVCLEDEEDHPMALGQADIALDILGPLSGGVYRVPSVQGSRMTRILSAVNLGDFVSVYLAYLNGVDPTPIENIEYLKRRLRSSAG